MLEKSDLTQIRQVVEEAVEPIVERVVEPIVERVIDGKLKSIKASIKNLEADTRKIRKDINIIVYTFDNEYLDLRKRVEVIEEKVGIER